MFKLFMGLQFRPQAGAKFCKTAQQVGKRWEALAAPQPAMFYSDSEREVPA